MLFLATDLSMCPPLIAIRYCLGDQISYGCFLTSSDRGGRCGVWWVAGSRIGLIEDCKVLRMQRENIRGNLGDYLAQFRARIRLANEFGQPLELAGHIEIG